MKKIVVIIAIVVLAGVGFYFLNQRSVDNGRVIQDRGEVTATPGQTPEKSATATSTEGKKVEGKAVIGQSVQGREIAAYRYGQGETELLFIGGIHGGYEWNTVLVAYDLMDYLEKNPSVIPANVGITVIPVLNPDGLNQTVGTTTRFAAADVPSSEEKQIAGRFNGNQVDLNRNFDCDWQPSAKWQERTVSGGSKPFSEPESLALKNYVETEKPKAVIVWYSAAGGVFASSCHNDVSTETRALTSKYAAASGYSAHETFDFYEITGDAVNWLAKINVPAISVLLTNHTDMEWAKNQAGVEALLKYYGK